MENRKILEMIADKKLKQADIAEEYGRLIAIGLVHSEEINEAIKARWPKGLERIKAAAWKNAEKRPNFTEFFKATGTYHDGKDWQVCHTGTSQDDGGEWGVTTNRLHGSDAVSMLPDAAHDAKIIAALMNLFFSNKEYIKRMLLLAGADISFLEV